MSRADKTQTAITYDVYLDEQNAHIESVVITVLCASRAADGSLPSPETAFTTNDHVAFTSTYRFSRRDEVERFAVPEAAARLLR